MIYTTAELTIKNNSTFLDKPIILYRGDKNVEIQFILKERSFAQYEVNEHNIIEELDASFGQLVILNPNLDAIPLTSGTYVLSGTPVHSEVDVSSHSWSWGLSIKDSDNNETFVDTDGYRVWDRGQGSTFEITETTWIRVYFYVNVGLTDTAAYTVKPSLIKIK